MGISVFFFNSQIFKNYYDLINNDIIFYFQKNTKSNLLIDYVTYEYRYFLQSLTDSYFIFNQLTHD